MTKLSVPFAAVAVGLAVAVLAALSLPERSSPGSGPQAPCNRYAAPRGDDAARGTKRRPFRTAQRLLNSLRPGETGCLRAGAYFAGSDELVLQANRGGRPDARITIRSHPSERARLVGIVNVPEGSDHVTLSGLNIEGTGGQITVNIYAVDVIIEDSDVTNAGRGDSCMILGNLNGDGQARQTIVRRNRFHDCGSQEHDNKDHAIYASNVAGARIVDNVFWRSAAYAIQLYPNARDTLVAHNVIDGGAPSVRGGLLFGGDSDYASRDNVVTRNVIAYARTYNLETSWEEASGGGNVARNNCVWAGKDGNVDREGGGFGTAGNIAANPLFVNRAKRDYRLSPRSRCRRVVVFDTAALIRRARAG